MLTDRPSLLCCSINSPGRSTAYGSTCRESLEGPRCSARKPATLFNLLSRRGRFDSCPALNISPTKDVPGGSALDRDADGRGGVLNGKRRRVMSTQRDVGGCPLALLDTGHALWRGKQPSNTKGKPRIHVLSVLKSSSYALLATGGRNCRPPRVSKSTGAPGSQDRYECDGIFHGPRRSSIDAHRGSLSWYSDGLAEPSIAIGPCPRRDHFNPGAQHDTSHGKWACMSVESRRNTATPGGGLLMVGSFGARNHRADEMPALFERKLT